jgi:hypothetical protein
MRAYCRARRDRRVHVRELLPRAVRILDDDVQAGRVDLYDDQIRLVPVPRVGDPRHLVLEGEVDEAVLRERRRAGTYSPAETANAHVLRSTR